jgi:hypothetical protein
MILGIFDLNTRIDIVYGLDVVTIQGVGYGLLWHCTEVLYGMDRVNQW